MRFIVAILLLATLCGCGGGGDGSGGFTIQPSSVSLWTGETQTFTITSAGSPLAAVDGLRLQWSCSGGSFSFKSGLSAEFTAGPRPGRYYVTASDGNLSGSASVTIY